MIQRREPLAEVLTLLCHIVEAETPLSVRAAILLVDPVRNVVYTAAAPGLPDHYNRAVDGIAISPTIGTCAAAAATGQTVVTADIANDPHWAGIAHLPLGLGLVSAWSMPIKSSAGVVLGTFGTYFNELREPSDAERELVAFLAVTAALAIESAAT